MRACPACEGRKTTIVIACARGGGGCSTAQMPCSFCHGEGEVPEAAAGAWEGARARRLDRIGRGLSQRQEAARLGMTPQDYSRLEHPSYAPAVVGRD